MVFRRVAFSLVIKKVKIYIFQYIFPKMFFEKLNDNDSAGSSQCEERGDLIQVLGTADSFSEEKLMLAC